MFNRIYVENSALQDAAIKDRVLHILKKFPDLPVFYIDRYDDIFGKFHKPYLAKQNDLWLFLASKKGTLVKEAPAAYGLNTGDHYYFVHAYNCVYECQYCYLQGYFNSPDIVLFLNYEEIINEMTAIAQNKKHVWFHAGEFSDSLALNHLSQEIPLLHEFAKNHPHAHIELRTKSINTKEIFNFSPLSNLVTSFSLSSEAHTKEIDLKTPKVSLKVGALKELIKKGYPVGIHFDPIVYSDDFETSYEAVVDMVFSDLTNEEKSLVQYISIGVVRFTKDVYNEVKRNYPNSKVFNIEMNKSFDGKIRYQKALRLSVMNRLKEMITAYQVDSKIIYLCMEDMEESTAESAQ